MVRYHNIAWELIGGAGGVMRKKRWWRGRSSGSVYSYTLVYLLLKCIFLSFGNHFGSSAMILVAEKSQKRNDFHQLSQTIRIFGDREFSLGPIK
jgi:hypothetical protein